MCAAFIIAACTHIMYVALHVHDASSLRCRCQCVTHMRRKPARSSVACRRCWGSAHDVCRASKAIVSLAYDQQVQKAHTNEKEGETAARITCNELDEDTCFSRAALAAACVRTARTLCVAVIISSVRESRVAMHYATTRTRHAMHAASRMSCHTCVF